MERENDGKIGAESYLPNARYILLLKHASPTSASFHSSKLGLGKFADGGGGQEEAATSYTEMISTGHNIWARSECTFI